MYHHRRILLQILRALLWPSLTLPLKWLTHRKETCSVLVYLHKQVEKSVSQGLDVDALAVKVLLMSHQTPKLYILRQTESESIKCLSSIEKTCNTQQGQGFESSES